MALNKKVKRVVFLGTSFIQVYKKSISESSLLTGELEKLINAMQLPK